MSEIQIGTKIAAESHYHGIGELTVAKFTPTQMVLDDGTRIKLPFSNINYAIGSSGYHKTRYVLFTDEHKNKIRRQNALTEIKRVDFFKVSTDKIETILTILQS